MLHQCLVEVCFHDENRRMHSLLQRHTRKSRANGFIKQAAGAIIMSHANVVLVHHLYHMLSSPKELSDSSEPCREVTQPHRTHSSRSLIRQPTRYSVSVRDQQAWLWYSIRSAGDTGANSQQARLGVATASFSSTRNGPALSQRRRHRIR